MVRRVLALMAVAAASLGTIGAAPAPVADAATIDSLNGDFCDMSEAMAVNAVLHNRGSRSLRLGLYVGSELRSEPVELDASARQSVSAWLDEPDSSIKLWSLTGPESAPVRDKLLDTEVRPSDLDCSTAAPEVSIGPLKPKSCKFVTTVDNSASTGPIRFAIYPDEVEVAGGTIERVRQVFQWPEFDPLQGLPDPRSLFVVNHYTIRDFEVRLDDRILDVDCDVPVRSWYYAGVRAPLPDTNQLLAARVDVPALARSCSAGPASYHLELEVSDTSGSRRGSANVTGRCDAGVAVYAAYVSFDGQSTEMVVDVGDQLKVHLDRAGITIDNVTGDDRLHVDADLSVSAVAGIYHATSDLLSFVDHAVRDIEFGRTGLADVDSPLLFRSMGLYGKPMWTTGIGPDDSLGFTMTRP